jgi:hypothetical protein
MDKVKPLIPIVLDKERHLLLNLNAMCAFEEVTGKNMLQQETMRELSAKDLRAMLWACLLHEDEALKLEDVGAMIHAGNMEEISDKLAATWGAAMPETKEGESPLVETSQAG